MCVCTLPQHMAAVHTEALLHVSGSAVLATVHSE